MCLLAIERLNAPGPVATVNALYRLALVLGLNGLELRMRVIVRWSRHAEDEDALCAGACASASACACAWS